MKKVASFILCLIVINAGATSNTAALAGATAVQSVVNSGMLVYWQSQGIQSNLISTPTGTYVVPAKPSNAATDASSPQNQYEMQNNQQAKQDFFNN